ncbi:MAG: tripartite tricarboxylate transporter substrate binding protein [Xanthobacteraceae bacterium]
MVIVAALVASVIVGRQAVLADDYPSRPIKIVVGIAAGGITDVTTRIYADAVSKKTGQNFVVENRPGGGGGIAASAVQNSPPDGYTLLAYLGSQQAALPALQDVDFDPIKGFEQISLLFDLVIFVAVPEGSPAHSFTELLDVGRNNHRDLIFGSPGLGTPSHLLAARISDATKTPMQYVQYRGGSQMLVDLVADRVDFALPSFTVANSYLAAKKLRILAIASDERLSMMPDVPTLKEVGLGNQKVATWVGLAAPAGTPRDIVDKLNREFREAASDPELKERLAATGTPIITSSPEEMTEILTKEVRDSAALIKQLGLRAQQPQ